MIIGISSPDDPTTIWRRNFLFRDHALFSVLGQGKFSVVFVCKNNCMNTTHLCSIYGLGNLKMSVSVAVVAVDEGEC